jgi:hypothetical protein
LTDLPAIGINWQRDLGIDLVCERLWDIARFAHVNIAQPRNQDAVQWFLTGRPFDLPVDRRPLRDRDARDVDAESVRRQDEVLFISDSTPTPDVPIRIVSAHSFVSSSGANDVLYIGD